MTPDAFLSTIAEYPDDDGPRLVYADWLEERGDPLGEFIRVQCERAHAESGENMPDAESLLMRERELLESHRGEWLGSLADLVAQGSLSTHFRRGFVDRIDIDSMELASRGELIDRRFPLLRAVTLFHVAGMAGHLAKCPALRRVSELGIADWIYYVDAYPLMDSPHLTALTSMWLWVRDYGQARDVGQTICDAPGLRDVRLVHLFDSTHDVQSPDEETRWRHRAEDELNERVMAVRGEVFCVLSSSIQPFAVRSSSEHGIWAGKIAKDRQAIAVLDREDELHVVCFDADGKHLGHERRALRDAFQRFSSERVLPFRYLEVVNFLKDKFGFKPDVAHVREFVDPCGLAVHQFGTSNWNFISDPTLVNGLATRQEYPRRILDWVEAGNCVLDWGREYQVGGDGMVLA